MTHNAADRKEIRKAQKAARLAEKQRGDMVRQICATEPGRRYFWDLLSECNIFNAIYPSHPELGAILGERNVGLRLLAQIMAHCPEQFILMIREANERSNAERASAERLSGSDTGGDDIGPDSDPGPVAGVYTEWPAEYVDSESRPVN